MKVVWENDTWWRECLGITPDKRWYAGDISQARPLPSWLRWLPSFQFCFNDKVAHAVAAFGLAQLFSCWLQPYPAAGLAFLSMVGYEFLPLLLGKTAYVSVRDVLADLVGAVLWLAAGLAKVVFASLLGENPTVF